MQEDKMGADRKQGERAAENQYLGVICGKEDKRMRRLSPHPPPLANSGKCLKSDE